MIQRSLEAGCGMSDETQLTIKSSRFESWTNKDFLLVSLAVLIKMGDSVEAYLPEVITQKVSCELDLSDFQEGLLAVILYFFWAKKEVVKCKEVVQGNDFLILAAVTGTDNVIGRLLGYLLWSRLKFRTLQCTITATIALSYGVILAEPGLIASVVLLELAKLCYSIQAVEVAILLFDYDYYGRSGFELGSGLTMASGMVGSTLGTSLVAFLNPCTAVIITLVIVCVQLVVVCIMRERFFEDRQLGYNFGTT